jgi:hypothetical protein
METFRLMPDRDGGVSVVRAIMSPSAHRLATLASSKAWFLKYMTLPKELFAKCMCDFQHACDCWCARGRKVAQCRCKLARAKVEAAEAELEYEVLTHVKYARCT